MASPESAQPNGESPFDFNETFRTVDLARLNYYVQRLANASYEELDSHKHSTGDIIKRMENGFEAIKGRLDIPPDAVLNVLMQRDGIFNIPSDILDTMPQMLRVTGIMKSFAIRESRDSESPASGIQVVPLIQFSGIADTYEGALMINPLVRASSITKLDILQ